MLTVTIALFTKDNKYKSPALLTFPELSDISSDFNGFSLYDAVNMSGDYISHFLKRVEKFVCDNGERFSKNYEKYWLSSLDLILDKRDINHLKFLLEIHEKNTPSSCSNDIESNFLHRVIDIVKKRDQGDTLFLLKFNQL